MIQKFLSHSHIHQVPTATCNLSKSEKIVAGKKVTRVCSAKNCENIPGISFQKFVFPFLMAENNSVEHLPKVFLRKDWQGKSAIKFVFQYFNVTYFNINISRHELVDSLIVIICTFFSLKKYLKW